MEETTMKISIACDHGAFDMKEAVKAHLEAKGFEVVDFGCHSLASCDYPDMIAPAARAVASGECEKGIVLCTTGIGASIAANKVGGVRCALLHETWSAKMTRLHNDTNVMALAVQVGLDGLLHVECAVIAGNGNFHSCILLKLNDEASVYPQHLAGDEGGVG